MNPSAPPEPSYEFNPPYFGEKPPPYSEICPTTAVNQPVGISTTQLEASATRSYGTTTYPPYQLPLNQSSIQPNLTSFPPIRGMNYVATVTPQQTYQQQRPPIQIPIGSNPNCPICQGQLETDFPLICILASCFFFPIGLLCCLASKRKTCSRCGTNFY